MKATDEFIRVVRGDVSRLEIWASKVLNLKIPIKEEPSRRRLINAMS